MAGNRWMRGLGERRMSSSGRDVAGLADTRRCARRMFGQDNGIVTAGGKWIAAQEAPNGLESAPECTVTIDSFGGVFGAGGHETAGIGEHRRKDRLVTAQHKQDVSLHNLCKIHFAVLLSLALWEAFFETAFLLMTSKARF